MAIKAHLLVGYSQKHEYIALRDMDTNPNTTVQTQGNFKAISCGVVSKVRDMKKHLHE